MRTTMNPLFAVGQMTATNDIEANIQVGDELARKAKAAQAAILALPECFAFIGEKDTEAREMAEPLNGSIMQRYREIAAAHRIWLALGGFQEKGPDDSQCYNTQIVLNDVGETVELLPSSLRWSAGSAFLEGAFFPTIPSSS